MPEFFLELFSEEIPARMQKDAAVELAKLCAAALAGLHPAANPQLYYGPRRIAIRTTIDAVTEVKAIEERGPRDTAPEAALNGFLGKHGATRSDVVVEAGYYMLRRNTAAIPAADVILKDLAAALAKFSWPKSMRWGQSDTFTWVRPLRRIVCLLDGEIIPIKLGPITASNETEGHRVMAPGPFRVGSAKDWEEKLAKHYVIAAYDKRAMQFDEGGPALLDKYDLTLLQDPNLTNEVMGLVEWPVPLIGRIDDQFMTLPFEVRELSMRTNQKYFALRDKAGDPAPYFLFAANLETPDNGATIIAGNERVLRARLSDARHFWELDLTTPLDELLPKLEKITFHAKIGNQRERAGRIADLAVTIAKELGADEHEQQQAHWASLLCKADLVTGMVGEFPELQGIMGGYYAEKNARGWDGAIVGPAIKTHYQPKGPTDSVPYGTVAISVALADKLDTLIEFFRIGETPTGSGDPYALRRAALGVIRIITENKLRLPLNKFSGVNDVLSEFIFDRLRVKLRAEGERFDVLDAVLADKRSEDILRVLQRVDAISTFLQGETGKNLLIAYRRAANILRIEDAKDGPHTVSQISDNVEQPEEEQLLAALKSAGPEVWAAFNDGDFAPCINWLASLRGPVDAFFDKVTINTNEPNLRRNRLGMLALLRDDMHMIADFSKIEG
jgi:glycyl-tRNA synthetase beta chain